MKNVTVYLLLALVCLSSCQEDALCLKGSGTTNTYSIPLSSSFKNIALQGPVNLSVTQGDTLMVEVVAEPEMYNELEYQVKNNQLKIGYDQNVRCFETEVGVWVNVTMPDVDKISSDGISIIKSDGKLELNTLTIDIDGVGDVELSGTIQTQYLRVSGSAEIKNLKLQSAETYIDVQGSAEVDVAVSTMLDIEVDGSADIHYSGDPMINKNVSGHLDLSKVN